MIHTVRVTSRADSDPAGADLLAEIRRTLGLESVVRVRTSKVYRLEGVSKADAERLARELLAEDVDQQWALDEALVGDADKTVEVAYLPGVMNPEAASIVKAAADLGIRLLAADSSREYAFYGRPTDAEIEAIVARLLVNPTVERVVVEAPATLVIAGRSGATRHVPMRGMDDAALEALAAEGLYLDLHEMRVIQAHFEDIGRDPTDLELEVLAQTWSEHCVHKTFKSPVEINGEAKIPFMQRLQETSARYGGLVLSAFEDNSGVMRFYDGWAIAGKVETHNSPSAIEPYGGAMTGSGGVFRDILGTGEGATVVASTDMFCFAPPDLPAEEIPPGALPPDYLLREVVAGVRDYGNRMGIPTNNGSVRFHRDWRAKPTIIVGAYGLMPADKAKKGRPHAGDRILALGGRTGRDGIHGATFSSTAMTHQTMDVNATAVQIGNPIEEKRMLDAVIECRDADLIHAITDCGAGGFSSAIGEMGKDLGATVHLERAPLKYAGLAPWEIFVSESQERMVMAVAEADVPHVEEICRTYNVEVTDLGSFEPTGRLRVEHAGQLVGDLDMAFLHDGWPVRTRRGTWTPVAARGEPPDTPHGQHEWQARCLAALSHPTVASKEPIVRQYDHSVQGTSALPPYAGPFGIAPSDAVVLAPLLGRPYGLVIAHGLNPVLNFSDPYWGGIWAAAEALANFVAVGGDPRAACLIDNFIFPAMDEESLGALDRAVDACVDFMTALRRPFISGKDSLSSTYQFPDGAVLKIPPVLCVSVFGRIPDVRRTVSSDLKAVGSKLLLVGARDADGMGGSIYYEVAGATGGRPPQVDLGALPASLSAVHTAISAGGVLACHDVSEGGVLVALAEMGMGGGLGAEIDVGHLGARADFELFNETAGVFVVEVASDAAAEALLAAAPGVVLGSTIAAPELRIWVGDGRPVILGLGELREAWERPMREVFH